jgi:hypothetical protein
MAIHQNGKCGTAAVRCDVGFLVSYTVPLPVEPIFSGFMSGTPSGRIANAMEKDFGMWEAEKFKTIYVNGGNDPKYVDLIIEGLRSRQIAIKNAWARDWNRYLERHGHNDRMQMEEKEKCKLNLNCLPTCRWFVIPHLTTNGIRSIYDLTCGDITSVVSLLNWLTMLAKPTDPDVRDVLKRSTTRRIDIGPVEWIGPENTQSQYARIVIDGYTRILSCCLIPQTITNYR